ncbi:MAG TPA: hypothetical protein VNU45_06630 [Rummeliibacillus sp.]|nr:hypothetical protein [Rummeliibacillus sp.]
MIGSFLSNCWAAVIAFTIYFLMTFQSLDNPTSIIIHSFIVAIIVFLLTYVFRFIIAFVMYSPSDEESTDHEETTVQSDGEVEEQHSLKEKSSSIPSEDQAEELAKAVKIMMSNDE